MKMMIIPWQKYKYNKKYSTLKCKAKKWNEIVEMIYIFFLKKKKKKFEWAKFQLIRMTTIFYRSICQQTKEYEKSNSMTSIEIDIENKWFDI